LTAISPHRKTAETFGGRMIVLIDNYDSFTFNLVHYFGELGADVSCIATTRSPRRT
jgi:anthranilate/para-aminobenzoate synthase component II